VFFFIPSSYVVSFSPQGEQCGFEDHDYMIEPSSLKKMKDSKGCHGITWTEKCIVGFCIAEKKHKGDHHRFDFRDCSKHKAKTPPPKMFCTTAEKEKERNKHFNDLYAEITGASVKASGVRVDSVRLISPIEFELKITILPESIPKMLDVHMSNPETFCDSAIKGFEIIGEVASEEPLQSLYFQNETEYGDGYYRISGEWQKELPNWDKITLDANGNPVNDNWCVGSSIVDGKAICFPGNELVVAGGGKVIHLPWDSFTNAMRFGSKAPQGQCKDDREFAQVTEYGTPINGLLYYNSDGKETQILFVANIEATVQVWVCKNVMWSKNSGPKKMNLKRFVLTHLTLP
jgi:hypothetical protein